jgi:hypothetical protein
MKVRAKRQLEQHHPGSAVRELIEHVRSLRVADCVRRDPLDCPDDELTDLREDAHADRLARVRPMKRKIRRALRGLDAQVEAVEAILEEELLRRA